MGRKKSLHPSDILRKKRRKRELRKLQKERQKARKEGLRRIAPQKLLENIAKLNRFECRQGKLDDRTEIKRKNFVAAYQDVLQKQAETEEKSKKKKHVTVAGMNKILGRMEEAEKVRNDEEEIKEEKKPQQEAKIVQKQIIQKENLRPLEDLEFPPGLPRPIHLCPPPGIRPRPQRQLQPAAVIPRPNPARSKRKAQELARQFSAPKVQVLPDQSFGKKRKRTEDLFDPLNPENPFFLENPKRQEHLQKEMRRRERAEAKMAKMRQMNEGRGGTFPHRHPAQPAAPTPAIANNDYGPMRPTQVQASDLPALPDPRQSDGKLEVLLPDSMMSLRPTSVRIKRQKPQSKKRKAQLELAPVVGDSKPRSPKGKKSSGGRQTEYDHFLEEIESLMN